MNLKCLTKTKICNQMQSVERRPERDVEKDWEFWKDIILNPDGSINVEQLKKELSDFSMVMEEVPKVYCHITGDILSKVTYHADVVISKADEHYEEIHALKLHPDYDFVSEDKVFINNSDGSVDYFELFYDAEGGLWMMVPFTDKTFSTQKLNDEGDAVAEPFYLFGIDLVERCADYPFEELK